MIHIFSLLLFLAALLPAAHSSCSTAIIGAGIGGAYSAFRLASPDVCIFEAKERLGGRILTVRDPIPSFEGYTVDLGAYRYDRRFHRLVRLVAEDVLKIPFLCYTDPFETGQCPDAFRQVFATRARFLGKINGRSATKFLEKYRDFLPYTIKKRFRWGPGERLENRRTVLGLLLGEDSVIPEYASRAEELANETSYEKAMQIADEIIAAVSKGSYKGTPYSEISPLQIAYKEGFTSEEIQLDMDVGFANNFVVRQTAEVILQTIVREIAVAKELAGVQGLVTPVERRDGVLRRKGMVTIIEALIEKATAKGVSLSFGKKAIRITKEGEKLRVDFSDGTHVTVTNVILNIGKQDLVAMGLTSEPINSSDMGFRRAVERNFVTGASKTYCFWEDAWWVTKLGVTVGRYRASFETIDSMRYHDGHVTCEDYDKLEGCRGGILVSYSFGDSYGLGAGVHTHTHNDMPYTPLTNTDNIHRLIPGNMTGVEEVYFDNIHQTVKKLHKKAFERMGMDVEEVIKRPAGCVFADWRDIGIHTELGPGRGNDNVYARYARPVPGLNIFLANEAWGQTQGWSEGSLQSAERALFHGLGVPRPEWMDEEYHRSVIRKFNLG